LAGSDRLHLPGDCRHGSAGWFTRIQQISGWTCCWAGAITARDMLHGFVRLVWTYLVLASKEKS